MTCRDRETARGVERLDRELDRRRRRNADVDDVASDGLQRGEHGAVKHRARHATVPTDDDARSSRPTAGAGQRPRAEGGRKGRDDFRGQGLADAAANPRHADHETIVTIGER